MDSVHLTGKYLKCSSEAYLPATALSRSIEHSPSDSTAVRVRIRTPILVFLDRFSSPQKNKVPADFLFSSSSFIDRVSNSCARKEQSEMRRANEVLEAVHDFRRLWVCVCSDK